MAYLSLYRKYRPQTFADLLGQEHVSTTLSNAINEDRVAHAYLFTGPRGTGKTSTARILAKALNCEKGPTPSPCGVCSSCVSITNGSSVDVIEMDAASHSKVDETREVLQGVNLASAGGRTKVYVIDEVHMLSTGSFNALLKTLEEPPSHVLFILATTEAHKVPSTIVSRSQRFDFRRIPASVLESHLRHVAELEKIDIDGDAIAAIARHVDGGARDALSSLDQLSSVSGRITETDAEGLLGGRHDRSLIELFEGVAAGDVGAVFLTLHSLVSEGADARQLGLEVLEHTRSLLLLRTSPDSELLLDVSSEDLPVLSGQAQRFSVETLVRILDLVQRSIVEMRSAPNHRLLLEVALVRASAPETDPTATGLLGRIERLERRIGISDAQEGAAPPPAPVQLDQPGTASRPQPERVAAPPKAAPREQKAAPAPTAQPAPSTAPPKPAEPAPVASAAPAAAGAVGFVQIKDAWSAVMADMGHRSKRIQALCNPSRPVRLDGQTLVVEVQSKFHEGEMTTERNRSVLSDAINATLGVRMPLAFLTRGASSAADSSGDAVQKSVPASSPAPAAQDEPEFFEDTKPMSESDHDPVELLKRGLGAEVVEERGSR